MCANRAMAISNTSDAPLVHSVSYADDEKEYVSTL